MKNKIGKITTGFIFFLLPTIAAAKSFTTFDLEFMNFGGPENVEDFALRIMRFLSLTIAAFAALGIALGGLFMIASAGNEGAVSKGRTLLYFSTIGLAITLCAYLIVTLVQTALYTYTT